MAEYKKYKVKTKETKKGTKTKTKWKTHFGEKGKTVTYDFHSPKEDGYINEHGVFVPHDVPPEQKPMQKPQSVSSYKHGGVVQHD